MYKEFGLGQYYLKYYLLLLLLLSIVILFYIYYESYRRKKENLTKGEMVGVWNKDKERRCFKRLDTILDVKYEVADKFNAVKDIKTRDISQGGIGVVIYEKLSKGTPLRLWVKLPQKKDPLFMLGNIVWLREFPHETDRRLFYAGIIFTGIDTTTQLHLFDFISGLEKAV